MKNKFNVQEIENPDFIKSLSIKELESLSQEIREFLIDSVSKTGGHFSSNLGAVELTVALHKVFNSPVDKLIWDVGHQAYVHKILTGRAKDFQTLRKFMGMSGFPDPEESVHDAFIAGHASTSISVGVGMAYARDFHNENYEVVSIIGDGSLTGGLAFEALNHIGNVKKKLIVVLNDNDMSISPNVGFVSSLFTTFRRNNTYINVEKHLREVVGTKSPLGRLIAKTKSSIKQLVFSELQPFEAMGFKYFGPIDGHNLQDLVRTFEYAKKVDKPIIIHVKTIKGKGFAKAEADTDGSWHGVSPFDLQSEEVVNKKSDTISWSEHFSRGMVEISNHQNRAAVITPAMIHGSALYDYLKAFPERLIDVGIAEGHAVTMAGGMASQGMKPFVSIYSSFIQRAYDQIEHDVCLSNLNVVFGIDRAGITGADGKTHQGIYDIAMLRPFPNIVLMMPKDAIEAFNMLYSAYLIDGPVAIRYPRGDVPKIEPNYYDWKIIPLGIWEVLRSGDKLALISIGPFLKELISLTDKIEITYGINIKVINGRFIKPIDTEMLDSLIDQKMKILVYEEASLIGGLGSAVLEYVGDKVPVHRMGVVDAPIAHGDVEQVLQSIGLSLCDVEKEILNMAGIKK